MGNTYYVVGAGGENAAEPWPWSDLVFDSAPDGSVGDNPTPGAGDVVDRNGHAIVGPDGAGLLADLAACIDSVGSGYWIIAGSNLPPRIGGMVISNSIYNPATLGASPAGWDNSDGLVPSITIDAAAVLAGLVNVQGNQAVVNLQGTIVNQFSSTSGQCVVNLAEGASYAGYGIPGTYPCAGGVLQIGGGGLTVEIHGGNEAILVGGNVTVNGQLYAQGNYVPTPPNRVLADTHFGAGNASLGNATLSDPGRTLISNGPYGDPTQPRVPNYYPVDAGNVAGGIHFGAGNASLGTYAGNGSSTVWSDAEKAQIRYRLGIDGTATAPVAEGHLSLGADELNTVADTLLSRSVEHVEGGATPSTLCYVVLAMSHSNTTDSPGNLTIRRSDNSVFATRKIVSQSGTAPVQGIGP